VVSSVDVANDSSDFAKALGLLVNAIGSSPAAVPLLALCLQSMLARDHMYDDTVFSIIRYTACAGSRSLEISIFAQSADPQTQLEASELLALVGMTPFMWHHASVTVLILAPCCAGIQSLNVSFAYLNHSSALVSSHALFIMLPTLIIAPRVRASCAVNRYQSRSSPS